MARPALLLPLIAALAAGLPAKADARRLTAGRLAPAGDGSGNFLIDGRYQRGEARLARMRRDGELPDTIRGAGCRYDLAGDIGVAYYVRSCP